MSCSGLQSCANAICKGGAKATQKSFEIVSFHVDDNKVPLKECTTTQLRLD